MHHVIKINATACLYAFSVILNVSPIHVVYCALPDPKLQSRSGSACKSKVTDDFQNDGSQCSHSSHSRPGCLFLINRFYVLQQFSFAEKFSGKYTEFTNTLLPVPTPHNFPQY